MLPNEGQRRKGDTRAPALSSALAPRLTHHWLCEQEAFVEVARHPSLKANVCDHDVVAQESFFGTKSYMKLDGVGTSDDGVSIVIMNVTEYSPTWPQLAKSSSGDNPWGVDPAGYLHNGRKSGGFDSEDLLQLNLCANRMLKTKSCFVAKGPAPSDPVTLSKASIRIFGLDHRKDQGSTEDLGTGVVQFTCPGGNFKLHGMEAEIGSPAGEFMVHMDDTTMALKRPTDPTDISPAGLQVHTFDCPPAGKLVTLWSSRSGNGGDEGVVIVNYVNVDCFDITVANLRVALPTSRSRQAIEAHGLALQRLRNSEEIYQDDPTWKLDQGECAFGQSGRNWLMAGLKGRDGSDECEPPPPKPQLAELDASASSPPPPVLTVHGDPMAKIGDRSGEHLWIASGVLTPLLEWTSDAGRRMVLAGRTIDRRSSGSQWFKQLVVSADGVRSLDVSAEMTDRGTVKILLDGKAIRDTPVLGATRLFVSEQQNVTLQMSKRPGKHVNRGDPNIDDQMELDADGLRMTVWTSKAKKFTTGAEQSMYLHLNFKMEHGVPRGAKGLLAELAGDVPMSEATRAMFKQGRQGGRPLQPSAEPPAAAALVAATALTVHGELAATTIGDKAGEHLWIASGVLTPLLEWTSDAGRRMVLAGRTIDRRSSGSQWFKQLVITTDGVRSLDVSAGMTDRGTVKALLDGKAIRDTPVLGATRLFASTEQNVTVHMSKRPHAEIDGRQADEMAVVAGGLRMTIWTSKAKKFTDPVEQSMYLHLNFKMEHGVPRGAKGLLAELAGDVPMSEATRAMLKQGREREREREILFALKQRREGGRPLQPSE